MEVKEEPLLPRDISFESSIHDDSSQGSWFMEKDILRPNSLPPQSLFDSEEESEACSSKKVSIIYHG